jgi:hypothetical protein
VCVGGDTRKDCGGTVDEVRWRREGEIGPVLNGEQVQ